MWISMSYRVRLHPNVVRFLRKSPSDVRRRIKKKLQDIREAPFHYLEYYEREDVFKLRIGDYRALIDVDTERRILYVQVLDKRERIYKR